MFNIFGGAKKPGSESDIAWDAQATQGLEQAVSQAPVPAVLKNRIRTELAQAAEDAARQAGHSTVTAQDLMHGLLAKLPASMRSQVEEALKGGPDKLKALEEDLKNQQSSD